MLQNSVKKWEVRRRLEYIESRLFWEGKLNRGDLACFFGISILQASKDIAQYQELAPGNMCYDTKLRQYFRSPDFDSKLIRPDAEVYLGTLQARSCMQDPLPDFMYGSLPEFNIVPAPRRKVDVETLRVVVSAIREQTELFLNYQSMTRPEPLWRWVAPHALSFDGSRWHIRAFCYETDSFRDFLFSRILKIGETRSGSADPRKDHDWNVYEIVTIGPNPALSDSQKKVIERDFGMIDGRLDLKVRAASVIYVLKRLGLEPTDVELRPEERQIVLLNRVRPAPD